MSAYLLHVSSLNCGDIQLLGAEKCNSSPEGNVTCPSNGLCHTTVEHVSHH